MASWSHASQRLMKSGGRPRCTKSPRLGSLPKNPGPERVRLCCMASTADRRPARIARRPLAGGWRRAAGAASRSDAKRRSQALRATERLEVREPERIERAARRQLVHDVAPAERVPDFDLLMHSGRLHVPAVDELEPCPL